MKVYFDTRSNEWVKDLNTDFLAPETYFEIKVSEDGKYHNEFKTRDGVVEFSYSDEEGFQREYKKIQKDVLYRKSWSVPKDFYEGGLKYFNIKE